MHFNTVSSSLKQLHLPHHQNTRILQPRHFRLIQLLIHFRRQHVRIVPHAIVLHQIRIHPVPERPYSAEEFYGSAGCVAEVVFEALHVRIVSAAVVFGVFEEVEEADGGVSNGFGDGGGEEGG